MSVKIKTIYRPEVYFQLPVEVAQVYHLCMAWNWEFDADFVSLFEESCRTEEIVLLQATPANLNELVDLIYARKIWFQAFFDRATDTDQRFIPVVEWARQHSIVRINSFRDARCAWNKATMGEKLNSAGLRVPATLVLPSYCDNPVVSQVDLDVVGRPFVIKPAHGGGGRGVVEWATDWEQVLHARQQYPEDQYLLQENIAPALQAGRPAWFRVIYSAGEIFPCWWEPRNHLYTQVTPDEEEQYGLHRLRTIVQTIREVCNLQLFSTEIACCPDGRFVVVDYVNDPIDLRLQSKAIDGVPDAIVGRVAASLAHFIASNLNSPLEIF